MHELAICQGLVTSILGELSARGIPHGNLRKAVVAAGVLHQIVPDCMTTYYEALTQDTIAAGSTLELRFLPATGRCNRCEWQGTLTHLPLQCCEQCGSADLKLLTGRELYLDQLEIETDETNGKTA